MSNIFLAYDADNAGRLISYARLNDQPEELARVSNSIDQGNEIFKAWAINHGGSMISCGGDEGIVELPATALNDLPVIKTQYEKALTLTVSIGVGMKMSESFKALLAAKLRGKNRIVMFDKDVEKEIAEVSKGDDEEKKKIVTEYLTKHQPVHHVGAGGTSHNYHVQEQSMNPEIQQQQDLQGMPEASELVPEDKEDYEGQFRQLAQDQEDKERIQGAKKSVDLNQLKQGVAKALAAMQQQLPVLAQVKQASPETYAAVLGVVQGVIAIGRQLTHGDQQLAKAEPSRKLRWTGGGTSIPALGTPERTVWDNNYKQAVANYFTEGKAHLLKLVKIPIDKMDANHSSAFGNDAKTRLYHRMVRAGDKMPPAYVIKRSGRYTVIDGNRRLEVAIANGLTHMDAYIPLGKTEELEKGQVDINHNSNLPPAGMLATSTGGFQNFDYGMDKSDLMPGGLADNMHPEDFDQEQLAIGTQHEMEHTDDQELAREIAMDHLTEDPDYYKQEEEPLNKAISDLPVGKKLPRTPKDISYNSGDLAGYSTDDYVPTESYDYSHLLTTEQKNAGYSLRVDKASNNKNEVLVCRALHGKKKVGDVFGMVWNKGDHKDIEPHSCIYSEKHQGKGLGIKMYEALYSHAKHIENISGVSGKEHSEAARRVHLSLAKRHGLNYQSGISRKYTPPVYAPYSYELKAEIPSTEQLDESDLDTVRFIKEELKEELDPAKSPPTETVLDKEAISEHIKSIRAHHKLVPGEVLDSRHIVVQNASGKNAIRQVAAGMQRDLNENVGNPIGPSMGNPTSTRNKPSRI